mgnify:CR=1 FL=1
MEQTPIDGAAPPAPPSAEVAQAYLDRDAAVRARREDRLDRRELARLALAEAIVLPLYLTGVLFTVGESTAAPAVLMLVAVFVLWMQLAGERRESLGLRAGSGGSWGWAPRVFVVILVASLAAGIGMQIAEIEYPWPLRLLPALIALSLLGPPALRELREAPRRAISERQTFTPAARWATTGMGVVLGLGIWAVGAGDSLIAVGMTMLVLLSICAWWFVGSVSGRVPVLGARWRWPQWAAFAVAGLALVAATFSVSGAHPGAHAIALLAAVVCVAAFVVAAVIGAPDER